MKYSLVVVIFIGIISNRSTATTHINYPMIKVPKGTFILYIPVYFSNKIHYEKKQVKFKRTFFIGKYEVTNKLWNQCFQEKGCSKSAFYEAEEGLQNPSVRLNWHDAYAFSKWISKKTGKNYRLPTEEEWVYAALMGRDEKKDSISKEITYDYSPKSISSIVEKRTMPIGSINKNAWGMNDFFGNVWEWTLTCWYSSKENILKSRKISELNDPSACTTRIARGETRAHIPDFISDTYNGGCATLRPAANLGFRLIREIE